jgi:hypothetical protein
MHLKNTVVAVANACYLIGAQWRNRQALNTFAEKQESAKGVQ